MRQVKVLKVVKYAKVTFAAGIMFLTGYIIVNLVLFNGVIIPFHAVNSDEIIKEAVTRKDLKGKSYIICEWTRVTGFNYVLIQDERGKKANDYVIVSGVELENELNYEFLTAGNSFVFYVIDRKEYHSEELGNCIEYTANGWDVLYPIKHDSVITEVPKYILKSDARKS